jgi:hypothetical protein
MVMLAVSVHLGYLAAFLAVSVAASFALGWFVRRAQGPREDESPVGSGRAWETATTREVDYGRHSLAAEALASEVGAESVATAPGGDA